MALAFSKMHGAGNDFVVLDARHGAGIPDLEVLRAMADRHLGIGCDQVLIVTPASAPDCAAGYQIRNADGSTSEQCGNGARCIAAWLHRDGVLQAGQAARLQSPAGPVQVKLHGPLDIEIAMGEPAFDPARAGFDGEHADPYLELQGRRWPFAIVSMGNPHAVVRVEAQDDPALDLLGPRLTADARFRAGCNAGFVTVQSPERLVLRVHERGAGWTLACGSGACAAAAAMIRAGHCDKHVQVALPGGTLAIRWEGPGHALWMRGPASFVFEGHWPLS